MPRPILPEDRIHPAAREKIAAYGADILREVQDAIAANAVVAAGDLQLEAVRLPDTHLPRRLDVEHSARLRALDGNGELGIARSIRRMHASAGHARLDRGPEDLHRLRIGLEL